MSAQGPRSWRCRRPARRASGLGRIGAASVRAAAAAGHQECWSRVWFWWRWRSASARCWFCTPVAPRSTRRSRFSRLFRRRRGVWSEFSVSCGDRKPRPTVISLRRRPTSCTRFRGQARHVVGAGRCSRAQRRESRAGSDAPATRARVAQGIRREQVGARRGLRLAVFGVGGAACCVTPAAIEKGTDSLSGSSGSGNQVVIVIPDGVARISIATPHPITAPVHNNVAVFTTPQTIENPAAHTMTWYRPNGAIVRRIRPATG